MTARTREGGGSGFFLRSHDDVRRLDVGRIAREAIRQSDRIAQPAARSSRASIRSSSNRRRSPTSRPVAAFRLRCASGGGRAQSLFRPGRANTGGREDLRRADQHAERSLARRVARFAAALRHPRGLVAFVRNGVLENLAYSRYWAQEKKQEPTPGPVNRSSRRRAHRRVDEMIRAMDRGLLVTRFWYIRSVDARTALLTGLTRDGSGTSRRGGFSIRSGISVQSESIQMLAPGNVESIGASERVGGSESRAEVRCWCQRSSSRPSTSRRCRTRFDGLGYLAGLYVDQAVSPVTP